MTFAQLNNYAADYESGSMNGDVNYWNAISAFCQEFTDNTSDEEFPRTLTELTSVLDDFAETAYEDEPLERQVIIDIAHHLDIEEV